jgi:6-pyruvoyltetrahydropterin/6-carboxytetrahydropterin synthase
MIANGDIARQPCGMFSVGVSDSCMVAHSLADPFFGPAQRLHGATYGVEAEVKSDRLGRHGVVMDIGALRDLLRTLLATIDYSNLDDHPAFASVSSTTERLAEYLGGELARAIATLPEDAAPPRPARLVLRLRESPTAWASHEVAIP